MDEGEPAGVGSLPFGGDHATDELVAQLSYPRGEVVSRRETGPCPVEELLDQIGGRTGWSKPRPLTGHTTLPTSVHV